MLAHFFMTFFSVVQWCLAQSTFCHEKWWLMKLSSALVYALPALLFVLFCPIPDVSWQNNPLSIWVFLFLGLKKKKAIKSISQKIFVYTKVKVTEEDLYFVEWIKTLWYLTFFIKNNTFRKRNKDFWGLPNTFDW